MSDLKYNATIFFQDENLGRSFFCPMDKKMIFPHIEWFIGKCPGLCTIFFILSHSTQSLCCITQLFRFPFLCPNCALETMLPFISLT